MPRNGSETLPLPGILPPATLMSAASLMSSPAILPDTSNVISSPGSAAGPMPCASPAGPMIAPPGPAPVRVSRFRAQDSTKGMPTNDTSGPLFSASSPSAGLQSSLENRLRARTDVNGSPEYVLTWKHWDMPAGPLICALRASARHTSGNGCIGLPTPVVPNGGRRPRDGAMSLTGQTPDGKKRQVDLDWIARKAMAGWPTPKAQEDGRTPEQYAEGRLRGYETRKGKTSGGPSSKVGTLSIAVQVVGYATPRAIDGRPKGNGPRPDTLTGQMHYGSDRKRLAGGALNPDFVCWLMGYPPDWVGCAPSATPSSRKSRPSS